MSEDSLMVKQISFIVIVKKIRTIGIAITVGIIAIYLTGLLVASGNNVADFDIVNISSLIVLIVSIPLTIFIRIIMLKKITLSDFVYKYFNAYIISFAIIDLTSLFCITTNLFVNGNILYASIAVVISVAGMILNFPKEEFFDELKAK